MIKVVLPILEKLKGDIEMKTNRLFIGLIIALVLCLMIAPLTVSAKTAVKHCYGTETMIRMIDPGAWTFPDRNIHVRGMTSEYIEQISCPENSGTNTVVMNANWDENYVGPIWGTSELVTPYEGGGVWKVAWSGKINPDGTFSYKGVGKGVSGSVSGLHIKVYGYTEQPNGTTFIESTIFNPGD
jgi:hypothetical protein